MTFIIFVIVKKYKIKNYFRKDQLEAMSWCIGKGIKIFPSASRWGSKECKITIMNNGTKTVSEELYAKDDVGTKIYELYCHFYDYNTKS